LRLHFQHVSANIPPALQAQFVVRQLLEKAASFGTQDTANMLGSMARLGFRPSVEEMQQISAQVCSWSTQA